MNPASVSARISKLDALKVELKAARGVLAADVDEGGNLHEDEVADAFVAFSDLQSELLDIVVEPPLPALRSPEKPSTRTKVEVGPLDEVFPDIWFRKLEVQLEAAGLTKSASRFSELLRFLEKRH
ncbi:Hypothetical predicted protein, partial [Paramuricea clavata]